MPLLADSSESRYLDVLISAKNFWDKTALERISEFPVPERFFGDRRRALLLGDISLLWFEWFIQSLANPSDYANPGKHFVHVFYDVSAQIRAKFPHMTEPERQKFSGLAARVVWRKSQDLRYKRTLRGKLSSQDRQVLFEHAGVPPRCWVCGHQFQDRAVKRFLGLESEPLVLPEFVDVYKPLGLRIQDMTIQVDHVHPFSEGGSDSLENLRLICGWCNRHKSNNVSIYDVSGACTPPAKTYKGFSALPKSFWVVRLVGTVSRCEHPQGCSNTVDNSELTVDRINQFGLPSPVNLRVVCPEHHQLRSDRLIPHQQASELWGAHVGARGV